MGREEPVAAVMRVSDETRQKWSKAFGAELPEAIRPFAEDEQGEHVTNGGMLACFSNVIRDVPLTWQEKAEKIRKRAAIRKLMKRNRKQSK